MAFADLTDNLNLNFTSELSLNHTAPMNCFDLAMVAPYTAFVDCQTVKTDTKNASDYTYIMNTQARTTYGRIPEVTFPETKSTHFN